MVCFRAAFADEEVVPVVFSVEMGAFGVAVAGAVPDFEGGAEGGAGGEVHGGDGDAGGDGDVGGAVLVPEEVGVDVVAGVLESDGAVPAWWGVG